MKKFFIYTLASSFTFFILPLLAGQYVGVHGGSDYAHKTDLSNKGQKVGFLIGGTYGYDWQNQVRTEFEFSYREGHRRNNYVVKDDKEVSKEHKSLHSLSYLINACYDIGQLKTYDVTPFIGAGMGYCQNTVKMKLQSADITNETKEHDERFTYQLIAGAKYQVTDKTEVLARYSYFLGQPHSKNHGFSISMVRYF